MPSSASLHTGDAAEVISLEDAAKLLRVSEKTVRAWIAQGTVPYVRTRSGPREQHWIPLQGMLNVLGGNEVIAQGLKALDQQVRDAELTDAKFEKVIGGP